MVAARSNRAGATVVAERAEKKEREERLLRKAQQEKEAE